MKEILTHTDRINPTYAEVEFVIYYMQTSHQPQTIIFTPQRGIESREETFNRDLKELRFEDGYIGNLPEGMQDGRLMIFFKGSLSIETTRKLVARVAKISSNIAHEYEGEDPVLWTQFFIAARTAYLLKDDLTTYINAPFISEKPITEDFLNTLSRRITDELEKFRLKTPCFLSLENTPVDAIIYGITLNFSGEINQKQLHFIRKAIFELARSTNEIEIEKGSFRISFDYLNDIVDKTAINMRMFIPDEQASESKNFFISIEDFLKEVFPIRKQQN